MGEKICLGFKFTEIEEIAMRRVRRESEKFMENFGRGEQPGAYIEPTNKSSYIIGPLPKEK